MVLKVEGNELRVTDKKGKVKMQEAERKTVKCKKSDMQETVKSQRSPQLEL